MSDGLMRDVKFSLRLMLKSPVLTVVCVLSLALGIGANAAVFTIVNAIFFKSLPLERPAELVYLSTTAEQADTGKINYLPVSYPNYLDYKAQSQDIFSGIALYSLTTMNMFHGGEAEQIKGLIVSGDYFDILGVKAAAGRTFLAEEDRVPGEKPVVVLSYGFWQRRFGGNQSIIGNVLRLNNQSFTVVGVAKEGFSGTQISQPADFWVPMMMHDQVLLGRYHLWFNLRRALLFEVVARLKPGMQYQQAQAELDTISHRLQREYPNDNKDRKLTLVPLAQATLNPNDRSMYKSAGKLLLAIVALVLLITCANLASLLLARSMARRKEIALRIALGASRGMLVRQLLTESMLLSIAGGGLGLLVGWQGSRLFWVLKPPFFSSNSVDLSIDGRVLAFTFAVSILTGLLFGLAPALQASKTDVNTSLREKSNQQPGGSLMTQRFFLLFQVAFSVVALVVAGLLVRSLREMRHIDLGFESQKLMVLGFSLGAQGYEGPRGLEFQRRMRERVESVPGVHSAGFATHQPLTDGSFRRTIFPEGQGTGAGLTGAFVLTNLIGTGYLESSGIRLISGRDFKDSDTMDAPKVAIVNESLAKHLWPGQDVVGKRFKFFNENDFVQIVGVLKDSKLISLTEEPRPCVYTPLGQTYVSDVTLYVRTEANPISVFHEVEGEIRSLDPALPIVDPRMITSVIEQSLWAPRLGAELVAGFGIVALLLVAVGIYGILAYATGQRREEISIRLALGAQQGSILMLVLKQGIVLVLIGTGLGLVFGFFAGYLVSNLLFGVRATDPISFLFVTIMLVVVAALASLIPARRATKIAPMFALR